MPKYKEYTGETRNFSKSAGYKRRRRRKKLQKKVTSLVLSAALFGAVAGGTCYGINYGLETVKSSSTQTAQKPEYGFPGSADGFHSKRSGRRSSQCFRHCSRGTSFRSLCYEYIGAGGGKLFWAF